MYKHIFKSNCRESCDFESICMPDRKIRGNSKDSGGISNAAVLSIFDFMIDPEKIDVDKSLASGWLKGRFPLIDIIQWWITLGITAAFVVTGVWFMITFYRFKMDLPLIIMGLFCALGTYLLYKSFLIHKLHKVETMMLAKDMQPLLIEYFTKQGRVIEYVSNNVMLIHDPGPEALIRRKTTKDTIIIYQNCTLHFCTLSEGRGTMIPQLLGDWGMKKDLTALLN
jgi:hypothetical protein